MTKKKRRDPFGFFDEEFERIFERMMKGMRMGFGSMDFDDLEKRALKGKSFVTGYSISIGPDGKPIVRQFGDKKGMEEGGEEKRVPLVDVIEEKTKIRIIAELPGVTKENINLNAAKEKMEISVDTANRKYYKSLNLPAKVKPETANASYKNGVLQITVEKVESEKKSKPGRKIKID